jgi:hypothetical protein
MSTDKASRWLTLGLGHRVDNNGRLHHTSMTPAPSRKPARALSRRGAWARWVTPVNRRAAMWLPKQGQHDEQTPTVFSAGAFAQASAPAAPAAPAAASPAPAASAPAAGEAKKTQHKKKKKHDHRPKMQDKSAYGAGN